MPLELDNIASLADRLAMGRAFVTDRLEPRPGLYGYQGVGLEECQKVCKDVAVDFGWRAFVKDKEKLVLRLVKAI